MATLGEQKGRNNQKIPSADIFLILMEAVTKENKDLFFLELL